MSSIMINDEHGRAFCKEHNRDICHDCGLDFRDMNRMAEEDAGLKKKRTEVEQTAEMIAVCLYALNGMERMRPRPNEAIFENNRQRLKEYQDKLQSLKDAGEEGVDEALQNACEKQNVSEIQMRGLMQAWSKQNPGKTTMEIEGEETQKLYEQFIAPPVKTSSKSKAEKWTCDYCNKTSIKKLPMCTRCKTVSYCNIGCQVAAGRPTKQHASRSTRSQSPCLRRGRRLKAMVALVWKVKRLRCEPYSTKARHGKYFNAKIESVLSKGLLPTPVIDAYLAFSRAVLFAGKILAFTTLWMEAVEPGLKRRIYQI
eukprot:scaffold795_cov94-Skeletonema_dohrnii-CCMP3373.AAC.11